MLEGFKEFMENELRLSENSINSYYSDVKLYEKYYKESYAEELKELVYADVKMYKQYLLNKSTSPKTINRKLTSLRTYNEFLIQEKMVIKDRDFIKIQKNKLNNNMISVQDVNKIKHYAAKDLKASKRDFCFVSILCYGGLRASEITNIKIGDIRLNERELYIVGKGEKFRTVVINNIMYFAIKDYLEERQQINTKNPYLFISQKSINTKKPVNRNFCNRILNKYKDLCKLEELHPHLLRHFYGSNALHNAGYTIEQVASQMGHSNINTTKEYLDTEKEDMMALANKL